ncbi:hypothetical protein BEWA_043210 [Theileria equi strain WA]|uniref:Uncharacterized protein n=1 Tax=Theileria equi strain WA TaxID=1537102 RepID=L1LGB4_THEEQ|nr:hypothetical protein BEWA_043210 [Theileria equi strain WA]EKX74280.1 hypothetical protein BEWA_043210 [Theileria equi strain WA]|eukprot:XP_004833732.1 hypothetical protein BEWA_043210 [Theileria equi strain WA]
MKTKSTWRRVMYKDQKFPANYIDDDFLKGLDANGYNVYSMNDICPKTLHVIDHVSTMILMGKVYFSMNKGTIQLRFIIISIVVSMLMLSILMVLNKISWMESIRQIRMMLIIYLTIQLFQPVLQTLISPFSDDTVHALAFLVSVINIITQDYDLTHVREEYMRDVDVIPLNCLVLISIVLSSRFANSKQASAYLQLFLLYVNHFNSHIVGRTFSLLPQIKRCILV